jgi:hypothetical protein
MKGWKLTQMLEAEKNKRENEMTGKKVELFNKVQ